MRKMLFQKTAFLLLLGLAACAEAQAAKSPASGPSFHGGDTSAGEGARNFSEVIAVAPGVDTDGDGVTDQPSRSMNFQSEEGGARREQSMGFAAAAPAAPPPPPAPPPQPAKPTIPPADPAAKSTAVR